MVNKKVQSIDAAVSCIDDGAVILASGFGDAGALISLLQALAKTDVKNLTIVSNSAGEGKETLTIEGIEHVLKYPLKGEVALIVAKKADRLRNII